MDSEKPKCLGFDEVKPKILGFEEKKMKKCLGFDEEKPKCLGFEQKILGFEKSKKITLGLIRIDTLKKTCVRDKTMQKAIVIFRDR